MQRWLPLDRHTGIFLALITAVISGVSVYLNKSAVQAWPSPVLFTTLKNTLVGLALLTYLAAARPQASRSLSGRSALALTGLAVFGGSLPFLLFFQGLAAASGPSAALIHKSLFLWVALLAALTLGEKPGRWTLAGLALLTLGQLISGWPMAWGWQSGESLILAATGLWAIETVIARRLLASLPAAAGAAARMAGGAVLMWVYVALNGRAAGAWPPTPGQWGWLLLTSVLLLGYVTTWYAALKRAPATTVTSILVLGAVITAGLSAALDGQTLAAKDQLGLVLVMCGAVLCLIWTRGRPHVQLARA